MRWIIYLVLAIIGFAPVAHEAFATWKMKYANADPKIQTWYKKQHNANGQWCCDEADGHPYYGAYTLNADGSVTLHLKSGDRILPAYMVLTGPNPTGHAVWWYVGYAGGHTDFCFAPGTLS